MRILLIAPDQIGINNIPEVRIITSSSKTTVLNGVVSAQDVYTACRYAKYDILYFVTHGDDKTLQLSNGETLSPEDVAQVSRQCGASLDFFSSCRSGLFASYVTRHGIKFAVHTNIELKDASAWKLPSAFFNILQETKNAGKKIDYIEAFKQADNGDGVYGLSMSLDIESLIEPLIAQSKSNAVDLEGLRMRVDLLLRFQLVFLVALLFPFFDFIYRWFHS